MLIEIGICILFSSCLFLDLTISFRFCWLVSTGEQIGKKLNNFQNLKYKNSTTPAKIGKGTISWIYFDKNFTKCLSFN
jgi:hypothetical protein